MTKYLFDTSVIIGYWRRKGPSFQQWVDDVLDGRVEGGISLITDMELWAGVRNVKEERDHKILLAKFRRYEINLTVARRAGKLWQVKKDKSLSGSISDILIAATAEYYKVDLVTGNEKDFVGLPLEKIKIIAVK
jgi:predicted nucleic acid-binding protein